MLKLLLLCVLTGAMMLINHVVLADVSSAELKTDQIFDLSFSELGNINIKTVSKKLEQLEDAPATAMVITQQQIKQRGYESLEDALRDLPGFDFVHVNGIWPTIWTQRGLYGDENKRTLLLIDGIAENNLVEGSVLGGPQYSLHNIKRIEVIWGPGSALYGANAFNGIINLITKKGNDINGIDYHLGVGSFDTRFHKLLMGGKAQDIEYAFSASVYDTDGDVFKERHPDYSNSYVDNAYSLVGRISYKHWTLGYSRYDRPMGDGQFSNRPGFYNLPGYGFNDNEGTGSGMAQADINGEEPALWHSITQTAFIKNDWFINDAMILNSKIFYRDHRIKDSYEYDYRPSENKFSKEIFHHESHTAGVELQVDVSLTEHQDFIIGSSYEESNIERGYRDTVQSGENDFFIFHQKSDDRLYDTYTNFGLFAQYRLRTSLLNATHFIMGGRYDRNNQYGSTINPRLGVVIKPSNKFTYKLLAGSAYRAPNAFELFSETTVRIKNQDLKPEKARSLEGTVIYKPTLNTIFETNLFYNKYKDIIVSNVETSISIPGTNEFYKQNRNFLKATIKGLDIKVRHKLSTKWDISASLSYLDTFQKDEENKTYKVPNISDFKANIGVTYSSSKWGSVFLSVIWIDDRSTAPTNPENEIDGYVITNLSFVSRPIYKDKVHLTVRVDNLFDVDYEDPGIRSSTGGYFGTHHVQSGRTGIVKLSIGI